MTREVRGKRIDSRLKQVYEALGSYEAEHPQAQIVVRREPLGYIQIRVIDPDFQELNRVKRENLVWKHLEQLPERPRSEIMLLLVLTPEEAEESLLSHEFDPPVRSRL